MTHIDLFSGIGGFALAAQWAGFQTVAFVEIEPYAQELIKQNFRAVVVADDAGRREHRWAKPVQAPQLTAQCCRLYSDIRTFDGTAYRGATLLTGGFPCQPFSQAGKRRGKEDDRYLWDQMLRVVRECEPAWVVAENVDGLTSMVEFDSVLEVDDRHYTREEKASGLFAVGQLRERGDGRGILHQIMEDLFAAGYAVQAFVIPAVSVDAKHRRDRVWIVGHTEHAERRPSELGRGNFKSRDNRQGKAASQFRESSEDVADASRHEQGRQEQRAEWERVGVCGEHCQWPDEGDWFAQSGMGRVAARIPNRVDRLKGLGNAIVPQVAYQIIKVIAEIEYQRAQPKGEPKR